MNPRRRKLRLPTLSPIKLVGAAMVISILQLIIELPESSSLKDKRREINSLKDRLRERFRLSVAEVDMNDSIRFAHLGAALVSNSRAFSESARLLPSSENELLLFSRTPVAALVHLLQTEL